jgi:hypothetical protein
MFNICTAVIFIDDIGIHNSSVLNSGRLAATTGELKTGRLKSIAYLDSQLVVSQTARGNIASATHCEYISLKIYFVE